jgi:hypothetical protein
MIVQIAPAEKFIDEAGHVYIPLVGPNESCLRLNRQGSRLWREWLAGPFDENTLTPVEAAFLHRLIDDGALLLRGDSSEAA